MPKTGLTRDTKTGGNPARELYELQVLNRIVTTLQDIGRDPLATESTLLSVKTALDAINIDADGLSKEATLLLIKTSLSPAVRTHNTVVAVGAGSVPAGSIRGSIYNSGEAAGTWNGISIPIGVVIPWGEVGNRDTYTEISYDATGTTFIIEYTT